MQTGDVSERDKSLDGVRGLAFLLVLLAHLSNRFSGPFQGLGKVGVWVFFALSAFLLTRYFLSRPERFFSGAEWATYAWRRFTRIVPLFWLVVLIYLPFRYVVLSVGDATDHILFLKGNGHLWTIIVEVKFYLVLPIVVAGLVAARQMPFSVAIGLLGAVWLLIVWGTSGLTDNNSLLTYISVFLAGSIAAFVAVSVPHLPRAAATALGFAACGAIVLTTPSVWSQIAYPVGPVYFYRAHAFFAVAAASLIVAAAQSDGFWCRLFSAKPLVFLGLVSYSGYLFHPLILLLVSRTMDGPNALKAAVASLLSIAAACLGYALAERPMSRIARTPWRVRDRATALLSPSSPPET